MNQSTLEKLLNSLQQEAYFDLHQIQIIRRYMNYACVVGYESKDRHTGGKPKKPVRQIDKSGNEVNRFESITQAARFVRGNPTNIRYCLSGRKKSYKGYYWIE